MSTIHVTLKTKGLSAPEFAVYGQTIVTALKGNPGFPKLYPELATLEEAVNALNSAVSNNKPGDKLTTAARQSALTRLKRVLKAMAAHVEYAADNDQTLG